ncbi:hypothetical protein MRX96_042441 [Rhipicephalus microplus]
MNVTTNVWWGSTEETLMYATQDYACGVVKVKLLNQGGGVHYELRVRNRSVECPDNQCKKYFRKATLKWRRKTIYSPECQHMLVTKRSKLR